MHKSDRAVTVEDLFFYYVTPSKRTLIRGLPFKRISFERKVALDHVGLSIAPNRITALMGKNGSGKTTLIKVISGARFPQGGEVKVFGQAPKRVKDRIGLCLGGTLVYHRLTARENLEYFAKLYNVQNMNRKIEELAELLGLAPHLDQMVETFSFGMKAKLALARAMVHEPQLLILDEPTLGIDFHIAQQIRQFIRGLQCTVLLTTHYMEEAEMLADDLIIINSGKIIDQGTKSEVLRRYSSSSVGEAFSRAVLPPTSERVKEASC